MRDDASTAAPGPFFMDTPGERRRRRPDGSQPECAASCRAAKGQLRKGGVRASARAPELATQRTGTAPETAPRNARLRPSATGSHDGVAHGLRSGHPRSGFGPGRPESGSSKRKASAERDGKSRRGGARTSVRAPRSGQRTRAPRKRPLGTFGFGRAGSWVAERAARGLRFEHSRSRRERGRPETANWNARLRPRRDRDAGEGRRASFGSCNPSWRASAKHRSRLELACRRGRLRAFATEVRFPPDAWCQGS